MTVLGVATAFFLAGSQLGLLVGWTNTTTGLIRHADVDLWIMAENTPAFDYGTAIPLQRVYQARSVTGVDWAEGLFMAWNIWERPDGRRVNIELVGLDESGVGGPWELSEGSLNVIHEPSTVIVDELFLDLLGVEAVGDEMEILGERVRVGGISRKVRTFTASPFIFASIDDAIRYDKRYRGDEITYVLVRCKAGADIGKIQNLIRENVPDVDVMTTHDFALLTVVYWMLGTGAGITVVITAILGLVVGCVITSQTLYAIVHDHLSEYAVLLALGFQRRTLVSVAAIQGFVLGTFGIAVGSLFFWAACIASSNTSIPLEIIPEVYLGLMLFTWVSSLIAAIIPARTILDMDPLEVFK